MDESAFSDQYYDNGNGDMFIWSWRGDIDPGFMLSTFTTAADPELGRQQLLEPGVRQALRQAAARR